MGMYKFYSVLLFMISAAVVTPGVAVTARAANYVAPNTYANMYPYMNNTMRTNLNSGDSPSRDNAQINVLTRTRNLPNTGGRRVVARPTAARAAASTNTNMARASVPMAARTQQTGRVPVDTTRRVVARPNGGANVARAGIVGAGNVTRNVRATRGNNALANRNTNAPMETVTTRVSSSRCLADYIECMNGYCQREDTAYNRCYCSAKLAQIDATYQPEIDRLIKEMLTMKGQNMYTDAEMNEWWMETIGKYTETNSWTNLDAALNINWADTESRVRGQNAFSTGHEYFSQHLQGCFYMAGNLRDAYRSEINRDCAAYEYSLQQIKSAAESIIEAQQ